jgi:transposase
MLGRYSHLCDQAERLTALLKMVPEGSLDPFPHPPRRVAHRIDPSEIEEMVAGYAAGMCVTELVKRYQVDQSTVQKYVRQAGLPRRLLRLDSTGSQRIVDLYVAGTSAEAIGKQLNVSPTSVRRALARSGVPLRKRGRPHKDTSIKRGQPLTIDNELTERHPAATSDPDHCDD